ncbi:MAG: hypothetical protein R6V41_08710 [Desulfobacteraceae bacterium]
MKNENPAENEKSVDKTREDEPYILDSIPVWPDEQIERYGNLYKNTEYWDRRIE